MESIFAGMQPRISDRYALQRWLDGLPDERRRQAAAVIAARAVLRALPAYNGSLSYFQAAALAWVAARYPSLASELSAYAGAFPTFSVISAAAFVEARDPCASDVAVTASVASHVGEDFWHLVSADVVALEDGLAPSVLAGERLLPKGVPMWTQIMWGVAKENIIADHWKPWKDWYQRRLDGRELSEEIELLFAMFPLDPNDEDTAEQNARLAQEIARRLAPPSAPEIPKQGAGPHVAIDPNTGAITPAKPESLDAEGNNVARLRALHPQIARLARHLAASVSPNEQPELHGCASRYAASVDRDLAEIDFDQLWGEGVFLEARAAVAAQGARDGLREPLDAATLASLKSLLEVHGPFILSTRAGLENLTLSREFHQRPEETKDQDAATRELARAFDKAPEIISPETAELFAHIVEQPDSNVHPERSGAFKTGMTRNVIINVTAAATVTTIVGSVNVILGPVGVGVAGLAVLPLVEGWKKSKPFLAVANLVTKELDGLSENEIREQWHRLRNIQFDRYADFVLRNENLFRRALGDRERARWLHEHLDWLKRESEKR